MSTRDVVVVDEKSDFCSYKKGNYGKIATERKSNKGQLNERLEFIRLTLRQD